MDCFNCAACAVAKSAFGEYLGMMAVKARRTMIYISNKVHLGLIVHSDGHIERFVKPRFDDATAGLLADENTVLIFDGDGDKSEGQGEPPICAATTVLVTSPKRQRWKVFRQMGAKLLTFPQFSMDEIDDMLVSCFPELDNPDGRAIVARRFAKWGGIPRHVLNLLDEAPEDVLQSALSESDLHVVEWVMMARNIGDASPVSHRLFHLKPRGLKEDGDFCNGQLLESYALDRVELGTHYIRELVFQSMLKARWQSFMSFLASPHQNSALSIP